MHLRPFVFIFLTQIVLVLKQIVLSCIVSGLIFACCSSGKDPVVIKHAEEEVAHSAEVANSLLDLKGKADALSTTISVLPNSVKTNAVNYSDFEQQVNSFINKVKGYESGLRQRSQQHQALLNAYKDGKEGIKTDSLERESVVLNELTDRAIKGKPKFEEMFTQLNSTMNLLLQSVPTEGKGVKLPGNGLSPQASESQTAPAAKK